MKTTAVATIGTCLLANNALFAAEPAAPPAEKSAFMQFLEQDYLFGTWGGRRTWLQEHGIEVESM